MKKLLIFLSLLAGAGCWGQEFTVHQNGLIYSDHSVGKLKHIVDSLNLKFKVCEWNKKYHSVPQAKAHYINLQGKLSGQAKTDLENHITYADFAKKYPKAAYEENLVLSQSLYVDYDGKDKMSISNVGFGDRGHEFYLEPKALSLHLKGKWHFEYQEQTSWSEESLEAFYFLEDFKTQPLPESYSKWIQYSDCLIDTTATVFHKNAVDSGVRYYNGPTNKISLFNNYVETVLNQPKFNDDNFDILTGMDTINFEKPWKKKKLSKKQMAAREVKQKQVDAEFEKYHTDMQHWHEVRDARMDSLKVNDPNFILLFNGALAEAKETGFSDDTFEQYVARYASPSEALEMKRNRHVIGGCSMDQSPRIHAFNIALLSAETIKWEIFLRAHLDIMNDRFDRVSDGSWANQGRETYIKELEILDINLPDLVFGIALQIGNPAQNHYFGSIGRMGRALAETNQPQVFETRMLDMIADTQLDDFNRILMYFLFRNYNSNIKDEQLQVANADKLKLAVAQMPDYIASKIALDETKN